MGGRSSTQPHHAHPRLHKVGGRNKEGSDRVDRIRRPCPRLTAPTRADQPQPQTPEPQRPSVKPARQLTSRPRPATPGPAPPPPRPPPAHPRPRTRDTPLSA